MKNLVLKKDTYRIELITNEHTGQAREINKAIELVEKLLSIELTPEELTDLINRRTEFLQDFIKAQAIKKTDLLKDASFDFILSFYGKEKEFEYNTTRKQLSAFDFLCDELTIENKKAVVNHSLIEHQCTTYANNEQLDAYEISTKLADVLNELLEKPYIDKYSLFADSETKYPFIREKDGQFEVWIDSLKNLSIGKPLAR